MPAIRQTPEKINGTELYILQGVPLDETQKDQLLYPLQKSVRDRAQWFVDAFLKSIKNADGTVTQYYFNGEENHPYLSTQKTFSSPTNNRQSNHIYIRANVNDLIGCNYLIFRNIGQGTATDVSPSYTPNKFYFAFILEVEQLSAFACAIEYKIDVIQTYWNDVDFHPSFIEQATPITWESAYDNNFTPDTGDIRYYECVYRHTIYEGNKPYITMAITRTLHQILVGDPASYALYTNEITICAKYFSNPLFMSDRFADIYVGTFDFSSTTERADFIDFYAVISTYSPNDIASITQGYFRLITPYTQQITDLSQVYGTVTQRNNVVLPLTIPRSDIIRYTEGSKFNLYPYTIVKLKARNGDEAIYKPEELQLIDGKYVCMNANSPYIMTVWHASMLTKADNVTTQTGDKFYIPEHGVTISDGEDCQHIIDNYAIYMRQSQAQVISKTANFITDFNITKSIPRGTKTALFEGANFSGSIVGDFANLFTYASIMPNDLRGVSKSASKLVADNGSIIGVQGDTQKPLIELTVETINQLDKERVKSQFSFFGYTQNKYEKSALEHLHYSPTTYSPQYVKYGDIIITSKRTNSISTSTVGIPSSALKELKKIFISGIRFWLSEYEQDAPHYAVGDNTQIYSPV